ncbi:MAG: hydrogenase iron-sulfur subunit [Deltaproteobacteria bacterium]|nr:hydrogenase iron-sulfur subunit [Deltaproteobacteria bacterium]
MGATAEFVPRMIGIICNWCCYGGADLCGVSRFQYPPYIRLIRVMCSARVDLAHILRAFSNGIDGVFVGGCHLNDCHYVTNGNYDALGMARTCSKLLQLVGVNPERLRLEWVSAGEGVRFAGIMNEFGPRVQKLGPLGSSEGIAPEELQLKLEAATRIVPYLRLALAEKLQAPRRFRASADPQTGLDAFYAGAEFAKLFEATVADKLAVSEILLLLRAKPLSTGEIANSLRMAPTDVSRHMSASSRQGLVRFDASRGCYSLARVG